MFSCLPVEGKTERHVKTPTNLSQRRVSVHDVIRGHYIYIPYIPSPDSLVILGANGGDGRWGDVEDWMADMLRMIP